MRNNNNNSSCSSANSQCSEGEEASGTRNKTTVLKKGPWSAAEDAILVEYVQKHGEGNWNSVQKNCGLARCGKSCRLRWANHLRPNLKKGSFTPEEEMLILHLHAQYGNKWARMAAQMPGRTDNEIKNYWNTRIKRRQRAGLPIYPARAHQPPPLMTPSSNGNSYNSLILHESPRVKRVRDDGLSFQFPTSPTPLSPYMNGGNTMGVVPVTSTSAMNMFQMNSNRSYVNTTELPCNNVYNGGGGEGRTGQCRIMDALLQENGGADVLQQRKSEFQNNTNENNSCGNGEGKHLLVDSLPKFDESTYSNSNGMRILKRERAESDETTNVSSTNDDISKIFDMISVPTMASQAPEWHNTINTATDSCGISNGAQSSVITDDELGLELQHFASSITAQNDQDWNNIVGSSPWNNLPGIG